MYTCCVCNQQFDNLLDGHYYNSLGKTNSPTSEDTETKIWIDNSCSLKLSYAQIEKLYYEVNQSDNKEKALIRNSHSKITTVEINTEYSLEFHESTGMLLILQYGRPYRDASKDKLMCAVFKRLSGIETSKSEKTAIYDGETVLSCEKEKSTINQKSNTKKCNVETSNNILSTSNQVTGDQKSLKATEKSDTPTNQKDNAENAVERLKKFLIVFDKISKDIPSEILTEFYGVWKLVSQLVDSLKYDYDNIDAIMEELESCSKSLIDVGNTKHYKWIPEFNQCILVIKRMVASALLEREDSNDKQRSRVQSSSHNL